MKIGRSTVTITKSLNLILPIFSEWGNPGRFIASRICELENKIRMEGESGRNRQSDPVRPIDYNVVRTTREVCIPDAVLRFKYKTPREAVEKGCRTGPALPEKDSSNRPAASLTVSE